MNTKNLVNNTKTVEGFKKPSASDRIREIMIGLGLPVPEITPEFKQQIKERQERESREYAEREAKAAKERQAKKRLDYSEVPKVYINCKLDDMDTSQNKYVAEAVRVSKKFVENYPKIKEYGYGMIFWGEPGLGKTHMACALLQEVQLMYEIQGLYTTTYDLFDNIKQGFNHKSNSFPDGPVPPSTWEKAKKAELLVLDEIGVQKPSEFVLETLQALLMYRHDNLLPTILISNLLLKTKPTKEQKEGTESTKVQKESTEPTIATYLGKRIEERLLERSKAVPFIGKSYRKPSQNLRDLLS